MEKDKALSSLDELLEGLTQKAKTYAEIDVSHQVESSRIFSLIPARTDEQQAFITKLIMKRDASKWVSLDVAQELVRVAFGLGVAEQVSGKVLVDPKELSELRNDWKHAYPLNDDDDFKARVLIDEIFDDLEKWLFGSGVSVGESKT